VQSLRQPGSAIKPVIYAAALDKGFNASSIIVDSPIVYETSTDDDEQSKWLPKNYGGKFHGDTTFRRGLVKSMNIITIKILQDIGISYATKYARRLGFVSPINKDLSFALGSSDVTLLELTNIYSVFARGGKSNIPIFITKVVDREGNVLERSTDLDSDLSQKESTFFLQKQVQRTLQEKLVFLSPKERAKENLEDDGIEKTEAEKEEEKLFADDESEEMAPFIPKAIPPGYAISPQTAYLMTHLLSHVVQYGTGARVRSLGSAVAGKTGTTNDEFDAWFMGFTPDMVTGVWVGFDQKKPLGQSETGSKAASPIWLHYMTEATKDLSSRPFAIPKGILFTTVDKETGLLPHAKTEPKNRILGAYLAGTQPTTSKPLKASMPEEDLYLIDSLMNPN